MAGAPDSSSEARCVLYVFDGLMEDQADDVKVAAPKHAGRCQYFCRQRNPILPSSPPPLLSD